MTAAAAALGFTLLHNVPFPLSFWRSCLATAEAGLSGEGRPLRLMAAGAHTWIDIAVSSLAYFQESMSITVTLLAVPWD